VSTGSEGGVHPRNAMSMTNVVYNATLNWANHRIVTLEQQALAVINNDAPIELGWITNDRIDQILGRLRSPQVADYQFAANQFATLPPDYPALFAAAFPEDDEPVSLANFIRAIAAFGSIFISGDSEFDKAQRGEPNTMPESAQRGQDLFFSEELECFHCHNGFNFTDSFDHATNAFTHNTFHNNGLYNIDVTGDGEGDGRYPDDNRGLWEVTRNTFDEGKFRAPTLRNIELTAPYMHDGSIATLDDVIAHYARGGRLITSGANAGDGSLNPFKSSFVKGFVLNSDEVADLKAFLVSLTDWDFLCRESLADPFGVIQKHNQCPVAP
jgi:cytochrome c peroxidase